MKKLDRNNCPVCGAVVATTSFKDGIYMCWDQKKIYLESFDRNITYYDFACKFDENDQYAYQGYEVPPYKILIQDGKTIVSAICGFISYENMDSSTDPAPMYDDIFESSSPLILPWHDREKCLEKLKLLLTFS